MARSLLRFKEEPTGECAKLIIGQTNVVGAIHTDSVRKQNCDRMRRVYCKAVEIDQYHRMSRDALLEARAAMRAT